MAEGEMTLVQLLTGQRAIIREVNGGRGFVGRLATLGFTPGTEIEMEANYGTGPVIVNVRGVEIALGRHEAERVLVSPEV
jgi:ferrous iron transport protein A